MFCFQIPHEERHPVFHIAGLGDAGAARTNLSVHWWPACSTHVALSPSGAPGWAPGVCKPPGPVSRMLWAFPCQLRPSCSDQRTQNTQEDSAPAICGQLTPSESAAPDRQPLPLVGQLLALHTAGAHSESAGSLKAKNTDPSTREAHAGGTGTSHTKGILMTKGPALPCC